MSIHRKIRARGLTALARTFEVVLVASALIGASALAGGGAAQAAGTITYLSQFGSQGSGPGQFGSPGYAAFDSSTGDVYVTDVTNDVVEEFDSAGNYISEFGSPGSGNGQFNQPTSAAVDPGTGHIYVLDYVAASNTWRIQEFGTSGNFLLAWNTSFVQADSVAVDPVSGDVYVTDYYGNRVVKYDPSGNFLLTWGWGVTDGAVQLETCTNSCQQGIQGSGNGELSNPTTITVDPGSQDVYVADTTGRVQKFDSSGRYLAQFGSFGNGDGQFGNTRPEIFSATGIAVDPGTGDVYAVDGGNNRVEVFDSSGKFLLAFGWGVADGTAQFETCSSSCGPGIQGNGNGQFDLPGGDAIDPATGSLYVVDGNPRVEVFGSGQAGGSSVYVSSSANPSVTGQSVTYTATVSPVPGGGTVTFTDNGQPIASCGSQPVSASTGNANCTVSYPGTGSHLIIASFTGSDSPALSQTVKPDTTTTQVTSSANPVNPQLTGIGGKACGFACPVTFTATVSANAPGAGTPTGTVQFTIDGRDYSSATLIDSVTTSGQIRFTASDGFTRIGGSHTVTATYSGDSNFGPSSGHLSELVTTGSYFALGDSYSAGAGAPPYLPPADGCDRSALAWPYLVRTDVGFSSFSFHACTGSVVQDLTSVNSVTKEPPQIQGLDSGTQLVTLTWGGNNASFAEVIATCIFQVNCQITWQKAVNVAISAMATPGNPISLAKLYETIAGKATNATIIVMGYPRFFPQNPPLACYTGITLAGIPFFFFQPQMIWINSEIQNMDNTIANAVTQAQNDGYKNVRYVNGSYDAFSGHEMCTADPYYNVGVLPLSQTVSSFHPNQSGNAKLAQFAEQAFQAP